eukprot:TRINITY_DN12891_c0_g1_i2.p2 TRINITY_DN12891_c0_g1~~TRINITY_DN12891_c0_g1_i2.p2  ORF type:complete len:144 (+),score=50.80 TRINITY_DN12891_c0_g1_i2:369-800(+)
MFTLTHALSTFLGQLLCYPNAHDPMNADAAALLLQDPAGFAKRVAEHSARFASAEAAAAAISRETQGRSFCELDAEVSRKRARRASAPDAGSTPGTPMPGTSAQSSSCVPSELDRSRASAAASGDDDGDDDVSDASDIDLDME